MDSSYISDNFKVNSVCFETETMPCMHSVKFYKKKKKTNC